MNNGLTPEMTAIQQVDLELSVILGSTVMPIHQLLRMGHGAVIELNSLQDDDVMLIINDMPVAKGKVIVSGEAIAVEVRDMIYKPQVIRDRMKPLPGQEKVLEEHLAQNPTENTELDGGFEAPTNSEEQN